MARRPVHIPKTALTEKKRATLRASDFAVPSERKYPINDLFHARLALTYVLSPSNAAYRDEVVRAVMARYPELRFWWAARSKGVEAKRARKATSRRATGRRMVANPRRNPALDWQTRPVGDGVEYVATAPDVQYVIWRYAPNSGYNIDRDYKNLRSFPLRGQPTLTAAKEEAERDLETLLRKNPHDEWMDEDELAREQERKARAALFRKLGPNVGSNADWADPAYQIDGKWFLVDSEDGTLDLVKRGRWNKRDEVYEDETLARFDTAAEAMRLVETLEQKRAPRRRATNPRRMVANPYEEWMDEDELERERQRREDEALLRGLGPNVGLNADWMDSAYYIAPKGGRPNRTSGAIYLNDYDGDYWSLVQRFYDEAEEGDDRWETLKSFNSLKEAIAYIEKHRDDLERQALGQKSNPRRRATNPRREVETQSYFAAMEPTRAKYAERGPEELVLVRSDAAKRLRKYKGRSDREVAKALGLDPRDPAVLRQIALMREHPVVTNPRREVETEAYFAAMEPTRAKYAERSPEELVLLRSRAAKMLRKFDFESEREVAKALGLDPRDREVLKAIELMRKHPVLKNPHSAHYLVFLDGKLIDAVSMLGEADEASVRRDLVQNDGYDPRIVVKRHYRPILGLSPRRSRR